MHEVYSARAGLIWQPDAYFQFQPEFRWEKSHYPQPSVLRDTRVLAGQFAASRRMSSYTRLGGRVEVANILTDTQSDFTSVSGFITLEQRISPHWRANVEAGAERNGAHDVRIPGATPVREAARTRFAGRAELCHERSRLTICADASVDSEVSGLGSLQRRWAASLTATRRLSQSLTLAVAGEFQHASVQGANLPSLDSVRADARIDWRLSPRLSLSTLVEYRRRELLTGNTVDAGFLGIRLRYDWRR